jgi:orotate phosphoribosyltransferase
METELKSMKKELIRLLCDKAFQYSPDPKFKLVSGQVSRYYINCKPVSLSPRGMFLIGHLIFEAIARIPACAIGGMTFGADPMAVATAFVSELKRNPINAFSVRKNQKDHGIVRWIEGNVRPGEQVVIIDDVVTTGGSTIAAIERSRSEGLQVIKVVVLVDRQEGGMDAIRRYVDDVSAIIVRDELMSCWSQSRKES